MSKFIEAIQTVWLRTINLSTTESLRYHTVLTNGRNIAVTSSISGFAPSIEFKPKFTQVGKSACVIQAFEFVDKNGVNKIVERQTLGNNSEFIDNCKSITFLLFVVLGESIGQGTIYYFGDTKNETMKKTTKDKFHLSVIFDKKTGKIQSTHQILISENIQNEEGIDYLLEQTVKRYSTDLPKNTSHLFFENTELDINATYKIDIKTQKLIEITKPESGKTKFDLF